ncbi:MAG: MarR family winged helix-turn-helix transcriptional regulator [Candidatus Geothermincolia bacterium]
MQTDDRLLYLMARAGHRLNEHVRVKLAEEGVKLSRTQGGILMLLDDTGDLSMTEISNAFDVDNSAITGMVDRLEKAGYISRNRHPSDRRVNLISITEAGREEIVKSRQVVRSINSEIKEGFSSEEIDAFKRVLTSFFDKFPPNRERAESGRFRPGAARS